MLLITRVRQVVFFFWRVSFLWTGMLKLRPMRAFLYHVQISTCYVGVCGSGVEPASCYRKFTCSIPLVCILKCPWARYWTPNCSWCAGQHLAWPPPPSVYECMCVWIIISHFGRKRLPNALKCKCNVGFIPVNTTSTVAETCHRTIIRRELFMSECSPLEHVLDVQHVIVETQLLFWERHLDLAVRRRVQPRYTNTDNVYRTRVARCVMKRLPNAGRTGCIN